MNERRPATAHLKPFGLRLQPGLKETIEKSATENGRSLNAEIVHRLEQSLDGQVSMPEEMRARIQRTAEIRGRTLQAEVVARLERSLERDYFDTIATVEREVAIQLVTALQKVDDAEKELERARATAERYKDDSSAATGQWAYGIEVSEAELSDAKLMVAELRKSFLGLSQGHRDREELAKRFSRTPASDDEDEAAPQPKRKPKS